MNFTWNCIFLTNIGMLLSILYVDFIFYSLKSSWSTDFSSIFLYCVHVSTCICVYVCSYMHLWRLNLKTGYLHLSISTLWFLNKVFHRTWHSPTDRQICRLPLSLTPSAAIVNMYQHSRLCLCVLWSELMSLYLLAVTLPIDLSPCSHP